MLKLDPSFSHIIAQARQVIAVRESINALAVKVPGIPMEPATAYLVIWATSKTQASAVVYLHYTQARKCAAYRLEDAYFPLSDIEEVTETGIEFLESMGYMLDDPNIASMVTEDKTRVLKRIPAFYPDLEAFSKRNNTPEAKAQKAPVEVDILAEEMTIELSDADILSSSAIGQVAEVDDHRAELLGRLLMSY